MWTVTPRSICRDQPTTSTHSHLFVTADNGQKSPNKTVDFLNIIKDDLRRNNDDYAALEHNLFLETPASEPPPKEERQQPVSLPQANRIPVGGSELRRPSSSLGLRLVSLPGVPPPRPGPAATGARPAHLVSQPSRVVPRKPLGAPPHRLQRPRPALHVPINTRRGVNMTMKNGTFHYGHMPPNATQFRSYTHSKHYKKVRVDKLKRLVDKGKHRMKNHAGRTGPDTANEEHGAPAEKAVEGGDEAETEANTPEMEHEERTTTEHTAGTEDTPETTTLSLGELLATTDRAHQVKKDIGHELSKLRQHEEHHPQSPSPDQLDMAPARGPSITLIRFKGRLCQRSMLNMEGPTYGKDGNMVIGAYDPENARGYEFDDTTPANPILPRCCNCCKKSVLGCQ
ncbi:uncharacterized protein LOC118277013 [Spodoptera frugiperda]|uniref:Uncharacterized protein LOC118277013 n=1 Tax=Spodoptera frugiperda TaxID=7108 RepID=A0A9R0EZ49_SPOFR|nr:uncharacterized protein LOC118277013 [Spodoptera frugiperda]